MSSSLSPLSELDQDSPVAVEVPDLVSNGGLDSHGLATTSPDEPGEPSVAQPGVELALEPGQEPGPSQVARWYAVQVASSCEKKVKATLEQRAVTLGVDNRILEIEIPQTPGVKLKKDGSRQSSEEKVFPGYVLVQMEMDDDTWHLVKSTPKVTGFVGGTAAGFAKVDFPPSSGFFRP